MTAAPGLGTLPRWQFWIDRGGTFTDCLGRDPATGELRAAKVLSSDEAPLSAIRKILGLAPDEAIPPCEVRMGTTLGTNALLERRGARTVLLTTRGFADLPVIGDQTRPDLFDLKIDRPKALCEAVVETEARGGPDGNVVAPVDRQAVAEALAAAVARGAASVAVAVLHGHRAPALERELAELASGAGFDHVSLSHEVSSELGLLARMDTTLVDAYLTPLLRAYLHRMAAALPGSRVELMQSSGGLCDLPRFRGRDAVLSGPAGGVVAYAHVARTMGEARAIGFDMGGTSTDVSRWDGELDRVYESLVAGVRIRTPTMAIHTVAAGGGSVCRLDRRSFVVGPESTGADPGPLCYGRPGASALALTDVNLALGRVVTHRFPIALHRAPVEAALDRVVVQLRALGERRSREEVAQGFFEVAVENMAEAIRRVSVARGHDVRRYAMVVFGGAGGQHACAVARRLGIRRLLFHPWAGVLSAFGMGVADRRWSGELDAGGRVLHVSTLHGLEPKFAELEARGRAAIEERGEQARSHRRIDLRYRGTETSITVDVGPLDRVTTEFEDRHRREFGYARPGHAVELVVVRVELVIASAVPDERPSVASAASEPLPGSTPLFCDGRVIDVPLLSRADLAAGDRRAGPLVVVEDTSTIVVEPGWTLEADALGRLIVIDEGAAVRPRTGTAVDPVSLSIFANRFMSIAEQMGEVLGRTALSTNIRERRDYSCAVFDGGGDLVANAPHIPVHLGAMSASVQAVVAAHPRPGIGDVFVTNDPFAGGSHLPDVTVVSPVHVDGRLSFFVASRGHHADIGGIAPGSMPPDSKTLEEEGVVLRALKIVSGGVLERALILETLASGPYAARQPLENLADLEAQLAANRTGARLLAELVELQGLEVVEAYMRHVQDDACERVTAAIAGLPQGVHRFEDAMDDGTPVCVTLTVESGRMKIDFTGTGPEQEGNLNAPRAVGIAAVLYALRTLVGHPIPLNQGCLRPVDLVIPPRSLLDPSPGRAVVAGNVETSQRVVDVVLAAMGLCAASQGTMNNLTFGDETFGYYETIGGGAGAGPTWDGASGVHTHMTNTRITDPEVLETRFPVKVVEFGLRRGSGGNGKFRGGDGLVRELEFLRGVRLSVLSERRGRAPFGLAGGEAGAMGRNLLDGREIGARAAVDVRAGQRVRIETPGGGGWGTTKR